MYLNVDISCCFHPGCVSCNHTGSRRLNVFVYSLHRRWIPGSYRWAQVSCAESPESWIVVSTDPYMVILIWNMEASCCCLHAKLSIVPKAGFQVHVLPNTPANTRHLCIVALMLGQRRRRWTNINPTLSVQYFVLAGICVCGRLMEEGYRLQDYILSLLYFLSAMFIYSLLVQCILVYTSLYFFPAEIPRNRFKITKLDIHKSN